MIAKLTVQSYRCMRDVSLSLTPLHALIGPNDSGKSTILRSVHELARVCDGVRPSVIGATVAATSETGWAIRYVNAERKPEVEVHPPGDPMWRSGAPGLPQPLKDALSPTQIVRLDPDILRQPSALIPDRAPLVLGEKGEGLPGVVDAIVSRGDETWNRLRDQFRARFPFATVVLRRPNAAAKALGVRLDDGTEIGADAMSEGMLYYLAFLVLTEIARPAIFLVEEPENGLHPSRIADVVGLLRAIAEDPKRPAQVLIATHSPLVVNELRSNEVTVVTRDAQGTRAIPIAETPNFEKRRKVYELGELWLSYANGRDEAPLLVQGSAE